VTRDEDSSEKEKKMAAKEVDGALNNMHKRLRNTIRRQSWGRGCDRIFREASVIFKSRGKGSDSKLMEGGGYSIQQESNRSWLLLLGDNIGFSQLRLFEWRDYTFVRIILTKWETYIGKFGDWSGRIKIGGGSASGNGSATGNLRRSWV